MRGFNENGRFQIIIRNPKEFDDLMHIISKITKFKDPGFSIIVRRTCKSIQFNYFSIGKLSYSTEDFNGAYGASITINDFYEKFKNEIKI